MNLPENVVDSTKRSHHENMGEMKTGVEVSKSEFHEGDWAVNISENPKRKRKIVQTKQPKLTRGPDLPRSTMEATLMTRVIDYFMNANESRTWREYAEAQNLTPGTQQFLTQQRRFYDSTSNLVALGLLEKGLEKTFDKGYRWTGAPNPQIFARLARSLKSCQLLFKTCHLMQYVRFFRRTIFGDVIQAFPEPTGDKKKRRIGTVISLFIALGWVKATGKTLLEVTEDFPKFNSFGDDDDEMVDRFIVGPEHRFDLVSREDIKKAEQCISSYRGIVQVLERRRLPGKSVCQVLRLEILRRIEEKGDDNEEKEEKEEKEERPKPFDYFGESPPIFEDEE